MIAKHKPGTCLVCGSNDLRCRGNCGKCYQQNRRLVARSKTTSQPVTWDDLIGLKRATPSRQSSTSMDLQEIQKKVYSKRSKSNGSGS